jgi:predicted dinucleotide-binding enzyme
VNPDLDNEKHTMFICGNDLDAKEEVSQILDKFGWAVSDMGHARSARPNEPLYMLWCIKAFAKKIATNMPSGLLSKKDR